MMTARTPSPNAPPMCVVKIGVLVEIAMPMEKGLSLVRLLGSAVEVRPQWDSRKLTYLITNPLQADLSTIRPDQLVAGPKPVGEQPAAPLPNAVRRLK